MIKIEKPTKEQQFRANQIARRARYGWASEIYLGIEDRVVAHTPYGYRTNFGWKNTYYQNAETSVEIKERGSK